MWTSCTRAVQSSGTLTWISASASRFPAVAAGQRDRPQPARSRRLQRGHDVGRRAARRDRERHVARRARAPRPAARTPARTRSRSRRSSACSCRPSARSRQIPPAPAETGRPARRPGAARRPRCRRCRTPAASVPIASALAIVVAAVATAAEVQPAHPAVRVDRRVERPRHDRHRRGAIDRRHQSSARPLGDPVPSASPPPCWPRTRSSETCSGSYIFTR